MNLPGKFGSNWSEAQNTWNILIGFLTKRILRLVVDRVAFINFGTGVLTFPGGGSLSNETTVTHELEKAPRVILAFPGPGGNDRNQNLWATMKDDDIFKIRCQDNEHAVVKPNTDTCEFSWIAITW